MSKNKKGGKGGKGKKKEPQETEELTEAERELLNITITDLNQKMERMKSRCMELEMSNEEFQRAYEQLDEDRADVIAYLKRQLQEKEDELTELDDRLEGLQKKLEETIEMYEAKIKEMGLEYRNMSEQLTSEIKLLTGKLNALEEFRAQREELMAKFKQQKEDMEEQVKQHKQAVYEVEKKFIIGKDKLKKEMEARLLKLALDFQDSTQLRIAATTHRVIRENIAINNELDHMLETHRFLVTENKQLKAKAEKSQTMAHIHEEEKKIVMTRNNIQLDLINRLSLEYEKMLAMVGELQHSTQRVIDLEKQLKDTNTLLEKAMKHIAMLEERILAQQYDNSCLTNNLNKSHNNIAMLQKVLVNAVQSVEKALKMQQTMPEDEAYEAFQRSNLLNNLLMLFNTANLPEFEETEKRMVSVATTSAVYGMGDVGLLRETTVSRSSAVTASEAWTAGSQPSQQVLQDDQPTGSFHFLSVESIGPSKSLSTTTEEEKGEQSSESLEPVEEEPEEEEEGETIEGQEIEGEGEEEEEEDETGAEGDEEGESEEGEEAEETQDAEEREETEQDGEENKEVEGEEMQDPSEGETTGESKEEG